MAGDGYGGCGYTTKCDLEFFLLLYYCRVVVFANYIFYLGHSAYLGRWIHNVLDE